MLEQYQSLLETIIATSPKAHIAGGAVRDTLLDRAIKDVDLFLPDTHVDEAAKLLRSKFGYVMTGAWTMYEGFSDPVVVRLAKFEKADEVIPVCLIGLKDDFTMEENIARFDFGICMAAWNVNRIFTNDKFNHDREEKTFTLCRADNQAQFTYSMSRFKKLAADRYDGWRLVVKDGFENLAREHAFRETWYREAKTLSPKSR